ncbi:MAG: hypothetical protein EOP45_06795 [Sphingobacteriaceae bacterium]|nr:MAG: hypothetical protein EOP45_06795 [Sphingobacteriaceae bacterium]
MKLNHHMLSNVEVSTIDRYINFFFLYYDYYQLLLTSPIRYQGRQKDIIIISFVHQGSILYDWKRLHVACTRAKQKLYLVGKELNLKSVIKTV